MGRMESFDWLLAIQCASHGAPPRGVSSSNKGLLHGLTTPHVRTLVGVVAVAAEKGSDRSFGEAVFEIFSSFFILVISVMQNGREKKERSSRSDVSGVMHGQNACIGDAASYMSCMQQRRILPPLFFASYACQYP
jgi:hypothetical protein